MAVVLDENEINFAGERIRMIGKFGGIRQVKENEALEFPETLIVFE
jgi:hypothetical protein